MRLHILILNNKNRTQERNDINCYRNTRLTLKESLKKATLVTANKFFNNAIRNSFLSER